jgi:hypothetical protein
MLINQLMLYKFLLWILFHKNMMAAIQEMKKEPSEIENFMQYEPNKVKWTSLIALMVFSSKYEIIIKIWGPIPLGNPKSWVGGIYYGW